MLAIADIFTHSLSKKSQWKPVNFKEKSGEKVGSWEELPVRPRAQVHFLTHARPRSVGSVHLFSVTFNQLRNVDSFSQVIQKESAFPSSFCYWGDSVPDQSVFQVTCISHKTERKSGCMNVWGWWVHTHDRHETSVKYMSVTSTPPTHHTTRCKMCVEGEFCCCCWGFVVCVFLGVFCLFFNFNLWVTYA
jgi:hypothetical protein